MFLRGTINRGVILHAVADVRIGSTYWNAIVYKTFRHIDLEIRITSAVESKDGDK
jgi:hypothetical protein